MRSMRWFLALVLLGWAPVRAQEGEFLFALGDVSASVQGEFRLPILADAPVPYQGFSLTVRYPSNEISVDRISVEGTIIEAIHADFVHGEAFPSDDIFTVGVLVDALPPFDGELVPAVGFPLEVAHVEGKVLRASPGDIPLTFPIGMERPAVPLRFSVDNQPVLPQRLIEGRVRVAPPPRVPAFLRGDANLDRDIDIADAIFLLSWYFVGDSGPRCDDAADANADDDLDVSDPVFLLLFLFMDGERPLPPRGKPGPDPFTKGDLDCKQPLEWMTSSR